MDDQTEFVTAFPKSGHRLHLKRAVKSILDSAPVAAHEQLPNLPSIQDERIDLHNSFEEFGALANYVNLDGCSSFASGMDMFNHPLSSTPSSSPPVPDVTLIPSIPEPANEPIKLKSEAASTSKPDKTRVGLPLNLPFPDRFSIKVEKAIQDGNVLPMRRSLVAEICTFYSGICSNPQQGDYKRMAMKTCEKFPELKDLTGSRYWGTVQKQLSQYFRNQRRYSKPRPTLPSRNEGKRSSVEIAKLEPQVIDMETQKRNMALLKDYKIGAVSGKTHAVLVDETYMARRKFIESEAKSCVEVLVTCPFLNNKESVRKEMQKVLPGFALKKSVENLRKGLQKVLRKDGLANKDVADAVSFIETKTMKKGASLIKFNDSSSKPKNMFQDKMVQFKLVVLGTPDDVLQTFVSGEDQAFFESSTDLLEALVDVISSYYVFHISYPDQMSGILYFLHDFALEVSDTIQRSIKYSSFVAELQSDVHRQ